MDNVFIRAMFCGGPVIAGLQMRPFAPHHALALLMYDNPLMTLQRAPQAQDAVQALLVCMDDYQHRLETLTRWAGSWWRQQTMDVRVQLVGQDELVNSVAEYIAHDSRSPEISYKDEDTAESGIPWPMRLVLNAAAAIPGAPWAELWDMPCNALNCIAAGKAETAGHVVMDELVSEMAKAWANMDPAVRARMEQEVKQCQI